MPVSSNIQTAVIGAGPAGLMAAEVLRNGGAEVTVYDAMPSAGRKFLMAGRGGLNLTHSEPVSDFLSRYGDAASHLSTPIASFPPEALRRWCEELGEPTFIGSSGRVFPQSFKASPLLRAWLRRLDRSGVRLALRHRWCGWTEDGELGFVSPEGTRSVRSAATVLALGGASWPRLGSDGAWQQILADRGVLLSPLRPANCGFKVTWSDKFRDRFEGAALKGVALSFASQSVRGEAVITRTGIEGGAIYALSASMREALLRTGGATAHLALRPDLPEEELIARLSVSRGKHSLANWLRKVLRLSPPAIGLLQEAAIRRGMSLSSLSPASLAEWINALPLQLEGTAPIERAISTAGGVSFSELDADFMIRRLPGIFAAGEMLDWEATTGGYLLQACFATGAAAGRGALKLLRSAAPIASEVDTGSREENASNTNN